MEALRIYGTNKHNSEVVSVRYLGVLRIHNRWQQLKQTSY